ncbi:unnamed protein product [Lepeophtheirus salmonis]|uniref:(salmon louse) hypothetical protein n=1 Tax=Lepeophtheirus salmonis TaxID=72036 RepID=A0A7R8D6N9_LEPSM|nr:unnamed protein product [Lepeophtheirus salmonis]CAF3019514.1 unnamed protein product [Lepeophtheirus salmonis]
MEQLTKCRAFANLSLKGVYDRFHFYFKASEILVSTSYLPESKILMFNSNQEDLARIYLKEEGTSNFESMDNQEIKDSSCNGKFWIALIENRTFWIVRREAEIGRWLRLFSGPGDMPLDETHTSQVDLFEFLVLIVSSSGLEANIRMLSTIFFTPFKLFNTLLTAQTKFIFGSNQSHWNSTVSRTSEGCKECDL